MITVSSPYLIVVFASRLAPRCILILPALKLFLLFFVVLFEGVLFQDQESFDTLAGLASVLFCSSLITVTVFNYFGRSIIYPSSLKYLHKLTMSMTDKIFLIVDKVCKNTVPESKLKSLKLSSHLP